MVSAMTLFSVAAGAAVARLTDHVPARVEVLETVAGILLLGGFAAIGCALPAML